MSDQLWREVRNAPNSEDAAKKLGECLGLDGAASPQLTERVLADSQFGKMLIGLRNIPEMRDRLIAEQPRVKPKTVDVLKQATKGALKWGMKGLKPAEPWVIGRRLAACNACEHQVPAPDTLVYRGAKVLVGKDAKVCEICNCLTNTKAAISTERCPKRSEEDPGQSKWNEPWVDPQDHAQGPW